MALTQDGIAEEAGFPVRHFSILVGPLVRGGFVHEWMAHVPRSRQRRKAYALTGSGIGSAQRLRDSLQSEGIPVRNGNAVRHVLISELIGEMRGAPLVRI